MVLETDAFAGERFAGEISSIDPKVDPATRNIQVRATSATQSGSLLPGMFATVSDRHGGPQRFNHAAADVGVLQPLRRYRIRGGGTKGPGWKALLLAQQKFVTTGGTRGDQVAILSASRKAIGWSPPADKLRTGVPVIVNNSIQPGTPVPPAQGPVSEERK